MSLSQEEINEAKYKATVNQEEQQNHDRTKVVAQLRPILSSIKDAVKTLADIEAERARNIARLDQMDQKWNAMIEAIFTPPTIHDQYY